jgi:6-phosphogluconolactonase
MELVGAPVNELRTVLTSSFEDWARVSAARSITSSCALSGGATALFFLGALRNAAVDWRRITLFWADERAVAPDDPESNYGLAERMLLQPLGAKAPRALRMPTDKFALDQAAIWYDGVLATELRDDALDLALLGVGEDGHVCSLFPDHPALLEDDSRTVVVEDAPKPPPRRLSLSLPFVLQTRKIWLIVIGPRKLPVLQAAINKSGSGTSPLELVLAHGKDVTVFTDQQLRRG